jgi:Raf kinase inhibitor-like YbhB/YbcL family protein
MKLTSLSFSDHEAIPTRYALAQIDPDPRKHIVLAENCNPQFSWDEVPAGTQSFALVCLDRDAPSQVDHVNQEEREIDRNLPRINFFHWVLVDLPADKREISEGEFSVDLRRYEQETHQDLNDYSRWFKVDRAMQGDCIHYNGPYPPWNDVLVHRYVFTLYALNTVRLDVRDTSGQRLEAFTGQQALEAIQARALAQASLMGTYTLNPALAPILIGTTSA